MVTVPPDEPQRGVPMEADSTVAQPEARAVTATDEPSMKRLKVGQIAMVHVDETDVVQTTDIDVNMFEYDAAEHQQGGDDDSHNDVLSGVDDELLWLRFSEEEPSLSHEHPAQMDALVDQFEIQRLLQWEFWNDAQEWKIPASMEIL